MRRRREIIGRRRAKLHVAVVEPGQDLSLGGEAIQHRPALGMLGRRERQGCGCWPGQKFGLEPAAGCVIPGKLHDGASARRALHGAGHRVMIGVTAFIRMRHDRLDAVPVEHVGERRCDRADMQRCILIRQAQRHPLQPRHVGNRHRPLEFRCTKRAVCGRSTVPSRVRQCPWRTVGHMQKQQSRKAREHPAQRQRLVIRMSHDERHIRAWLSRCEGG